MTKIDFDSKQKRVDLSNRGATSTRNMFNNHPQHVKTRSMPAHVVAQAMSSPVAQQQQPVQPQQAVPMQQQATPQQQAQSSPVNPHHARTVSAPLSNLNNANSANSLFSQPLAESVLVLFLQQFKEQAQLAIDEFAYQQVRAKFFTLDC